MAKKRYGNIAIIVLIILNILLWFLALDDVNTLEYIFKQFLSEILSSSTMILWSCSFILATRWKKLEPFFGGLDRMYITHKYCAMSGFFLIILHILLIPEAETTSLAIILGRIAFDGFIVLMLLTILSKKIKMTYRTWKFSHKFMGVFYLIGMIHYQTSHALVHDYPLPKYVLIFFSIIGLFAWLYQELFYTALNKLPYTILNITGSGDITELFLTAERKKTYFIPGQFIFINFPDIKKLKEYHPFTISNSSNDKTLRLSIKAEGDFTTQLKNELQIGGAASVIGAYGLFNYHTCNSDQIWIAGGIGITPFLSWLHSFSNSFKHNISLFYCLKNEEEAIYSEEIATIQQQFRQIKFYSHFSQSEGHISAEKIRDKVGDLKEKNIFICGPLPLRKSLLRQCHKLGVKKKQIHFEEFQFK